MPTTDTNCNTTQTAPGWSHTTAPSSPSHYPHPDATDGPTTPPPLGQRSLRSRSLPFVERLIGWNLCDAAIELIETEPGSRWAVHQNGQPLPDHVVTYDPQTTYYTYQWTKN
jgi:hypothetical protein